MGWDGGICVQVRLLKNGSNWPSCDTGIILQRGRRGRRAPQTHFFSSSRISQTIGLKARTIKNHRGKICLYLHLSGQNFRDFQRFRCKKSVFEALYSLLFLIRITPVPIASKEPRMVNPGASSFSLSTDAAGLTIFCEFWMRINPSGKGISAVVPFSLV